MSKKIILDTDYILQEYNKGRTFQNISKELGCNKTTIIKYAKKAGIIPRSGGRKIADVENKKFGKLQVLYKSNNKYKNPKFVCKCDCDNIVEVSSGELINGRQMCWNCRNKNLSSIKWKGYGEISGEFFSKIKRSAKVRNFKFELTIEQIWKLFLQQERKCALSGMPLVFYRRREDRGLITASLDRIDSNGHYTVDNVQWVHKILNNLKMDLPESEFFEWCRLITEYQKNKVKNVNSQISGTKINTSAQMVA